MYINGVIAFVRKDFEHRFQRAFHSVFVAYRVTRSIRKTTSVVFVLHGVAFCVSVIRQSVPHRVFENIRILTDSTFIIRERRVDVVRRLVRVVFILSSEIYLRSDFQIVLKGFKPLFGQFIIAPVSVTVKLVSAVNFSVIYGSAARVPTAEVSDVRRAFGVNKPDGDVFRGETRHVGRIPRLISLDFPIIGRGRH